MMYREDEYGEVINGADEEAGTDTYAAIKEKLTTVNRCLIGWSDGAGTHYDILFVNHALFGGANHQGGINESDLFVAIMRKGAFGFSVNPGTEHDSSAGYVEEKLGITGGQAVADLINGVRNALVA